MTQTDSLKTSFVTCRQLSLALGAPGLELEQGIKLAESNPGAEALFVLNGETRTTGGSSGEV